MNVLLALLCSIANATPDVEAFHAWIADGGGALEGVAVGATEYGRGVVATRDIAEGDRILTVPLSHVICRRTIIASAPSKLKKKLAAVESDTDLVAVFLLRERALGAESTWEPYLKLLPSMVPIPASFSDEELAEIQVPAATGQARNTRRSVLKRHAALVKSGLLGALARGIAAAASKEMRTARAFAWADAMVNSRALTIEGSKYLVPFADMTNYAPHSDAMTRKHDSGASFLKYHRLDDKTFDVYADRDVAKGEQMFEDYGDNDGDVYFHHHAMVPAVNPFDCARLTAPAPPAGSHREALVKKLGVPLAPSACVSPSRPLPSGMKYHLWLLMMSEKSAKKCLARVNASPQRGAAGCFKGLVEQSIFESADVGALMRNVVETELRSFATTLEEDRAMLEATSPVPSVAVRLAIQYRASRKQLLRGLVARFKAPAAATPAASAAASAAADEVLLGRAAAHLKVLAASEALPRASARVLLGKLAAHAATLLARSPAAAVDATVDATLDANPTRSGGDVALQTQVDEFNAWFARESASIAKIAPLRVTATLVRASRLPLHFMRIPLTI